MKISLNYISQFLDFDLPPIDELADIIGSKLGAMEDRPVSLSELYSNAVIVKIEDCQPIEGSDHLNLCLVNDGKKVSDVQRNPNDLVSVVCGAPNVKAGQTAVWLPPGSIVPSTFFKEQLKLEARPIRGTVSNGMLASSKELALSDDHEGILTIDQEISPGTSLVEALELDDVIIDIENKMFTHRPDCFGLVGVAREISGILNKPFKSPQWYLNSDQPKPEAHSANLKINNEIPSKVPRFCLIAIDGIEIKPSPLLVQSYLYRLGIRPINNIVDLTNLVMIETGQPLHAYDYNKLVSIAGNGLAIGVRAPKPDESLTLLSGKIVKPTENSICITAGDRLIGLAGVMGGQNSEVDADTKAIVLESACFNMNDIRRTSMELGVFSESVTRFTKSQSPLQNARVLNYAVAKIKELLPNSKVVTDIVDDNNVAEETLKRDSVYPDISVSTEFINKRLGTDLSAQDISNILTNVEFQVAVSDNSFTVKAPFWRTDIEIREDIVEEVGRLYGFQNISLQPLIRPAAATPKNKSLESKAGIRQLLAAAGANELLTYSFVSKRLVENVDQSVDKAFEIANSLSPELNYFRLSLTPSLLSKVHMNIKSGFDEFAIFELGTYHLKDQFVKSGTDEDMPAEYQSLSLVYSSKHPLKSAAYFKAKTYLDYLFKELNVSEVSYVTLDKATDLDIQLVELSKPFEPKRSALVKYGDQQIGIVGEFKSSVTTRLKLTKYCSGFEVDSRVFLNQKLDQVYKSLSKYPPLKQDITLSVPGSVTYGELSGYLLGEIDKLVSKASSYEFTPTSIFKPKDSDGFVHYSFHFVISDDNKTLKDQEVNVILDKLAQSAKEKVEADRV